MICTRTIPSLASVVSITTILIVRSLMAAPFVSLPVAANAEAFITASVLTWERLRASVGVLVNSQGTWP